MAADSKITAGALWWKTTDDLVESIESAEDVQIEIGYEDDTIYIDGLRDGHYIAIDLSSIGEALAACARK